MAIYILFGLPGVGKTYVGKVCKEDFDFYFYEGDTDLTDEMKEAIRTKRVFTDEMRDVFFQHLIISLKKITQKHTHLIVSQTFIKEKYRRLLLTAIPEAQFILVTANTFIREARLRKRTDYPLDISYARIMAKNFE